MTCYPVYLEVADNRPWTAHVLDLPGCFARAATREGVLEQLRQAIRDYHDWLRQHDEPAPSKDEPIEIEVAGEVSGCNVFRPGDKAALFARERAPVTLEDMERHFQLMAHSREDLLALVADLPDAFLNWQAGPESFSVQGLLRHIGSAEQWYVSRLVPPETLPLEWKDDKDMPLVEFLEMERRTALARLRLLTTEERSTVFYPTQRTNHPDEPWTVRKALRRFLEHEQEHLAQIREILEMHRRHLLAKLAAARAGLLMQLRSLDDHTLTKVPIYGDWTLKDVMAHLAAWDRYILRELRKLLVGERPDFSSVRNVHAYNAANVATWRDRPVEEVMDELQEARAVWVAWMEDLSLEDFFRRRPVGGRNWSPPRWINMLKEHDARHAEEIAGWREELGLKEGEVSW